MDDIKIREVIVHPLPAELSALSGDGKIWAGSVNSGGLVVLESGKDFIFRFMQSLRENGRGDSRVLALSYRGDIAAGEAENNKGERRAVRWKWKEDNGRHPEDLGTLRKDNTGNAEARALSHDGDVVAGIALNDSNEQPCCSLDGAWKKSRKRRSGYAQEGQCRQL